MLFSAFFRFKTTYINVSILQKIIFFLKEHLFSSNSVMLKHNIFLTKTYFVKLSEKKAGGVPLWNFGENKTVH